MKLVHLFLRLFGFVKGGIIGDCVLGFSDVPYLFRISKETMFHRKSSKSRQHGDSCRLILVKEKNKWKKMKSQVVKIQAVKRK